MVYVDEMLDWGPHRGLWCHMLADDLTELHAMAKRIGLRRAWFQGGLLRTTTKTTVPHYDLREKYRTRAVAAGAITDRAWFEYCLATWRRKLRAIGVEPEQSLG